MTKYEFRVLCYDGDSCDVTKKAMSDFTIYDYLITPGYDFAGVKYFSSDDTAQQKQKELLTICKDKVLKIDIYENRSTDRNSSLS